MHKSLYVQCITVEERKYAQNPIGASKKNTHFGFLYIRFYVLSLAVVHHSFVIAPASANASLTKYLAPSIGDAHKNFDT